MTDEPWPTIADIRAWAYDDEMELMEQDEDLLLHELRLAPTLLDCYSDTNCPKRDYILSCLDHWLMYLVLKGHESHLGEVRTTIDIARAQEAELGSWIELQKRRLSYRDGIGPIDYVLAETMADDLLRGICRVGSIKVKEETATSWIADFSTQSCDPHERLIIDKSKGTFSYVPSYLDAYGQS